MVRYWFMLAITLAVGYGHGRANSLFTHNQRDRSASPESLQIDAFDAAICGQSVMREWQETESGLECRMRMSDNSPRLSNGTDYAIPGEFPSFVHLTFFDPRGTSKSVCSGTLIHKNLVLVDGDCPNYTTYPKLDILVGSGLYQDVGIVNFCRFKDTPLSIVKFSIDIKYIPGFVSPACLRLDLKPSTRTLCAIGVLKKQVSRPQPFDYPLLVTDAFEPRQCGGGDPGQHISCYDQVDKGNSEVLAGAGATLYCFDNCGGHGQRLYAVGMFSKAPSDSKNGIHRLKDFNKMADIIRKLIGRMLGVSRSNKIYCPADFSPGNAMIEDEED